MAFTDRFLSFPVKLLVADDHEIVVQKEVTYKKINPYRIESYEPGDDDESVVVTMFSGDVFDVTLSMQRFEQKLAQHVS
jgi:hypothetical protein